MFEESKALAFDASGDNRHWDSANTVNHLHATILAGALTRALANAPAVIDVVTSQRAISSDASKGLGFVPDYQPLTAWDDAERKRRA